MVEVKVCIVANKFLPHIGSGVPRTLQIIKGLLSSGHDVRVLTTMISKKRYSTMHLPDEDYREELENLKGLKIHSVSPLPIFFPLPFDPILFMGYLISLIRFRRGGVDAFFLVLPDNYFSPGLATYFVSKATKVPLITDVRDLWERQTIAYKSHLPYPLWALFFGVLINPIGKIVANLAYRHSTAIIAVNKKFANSISEWGIDEKKINIIRHGVDTEIFKPLGKDEISRTKEGYNIKGKPILIYVGQFTVNHRVDVIIKAVKKLSKRYPDVLLLIVGGGGYKKKKEYEELVKELGIDKNVRFLGVVPRQEISVLIASSDIGLAATDKSDTCALGQKFPEYIACGKPIVAAVSRDGDLDRFVEDNNIGRIVEPYDHVGMADGIVKVLKQDKYQDRENIVSVAKREFDKRKGVLEIIQLFDKINT